MTQHNVFHGTRAKANFNGSDLLNLTDWTCEVVADTAEATAMGDAVNIASHRWAQHRKGFADWTATVAGYVVGSGLDVGLSDTENIGLINDSDITHITPLTLKLYFTETAGDGYLEGTCYLTGMGFNAPGGDIETLNYTFQGTRNLTFNTV